MTKLTMVIWLMLAASGCTRPVTKTDAVVDLEPIVDPAFIEKEKPEEIIRPVQDDNKGGLPPMQVTAPRNVVDAVRQALGDSGQYPFIENRVISAGGTKLTIPPGLAFDYSMDGEDFLFTFKGDRPKVEASVIGWKFNPPLVALRLKPNNEGIGTAKTIAGEVSRKFCINWESVAAVPEKPKAPVFRFHTTKEFHCPACKTGEKALAQAKADGKLPFEYEITEDKVDFTNSIPVITSVVDGVVYTPVYAKDEPSLGKKKGDLRPGWHGVDDAIDWWKQLPKPKK